MIILAWRVVRLCYLAVEACVYPLGSSSPQTTPHGDILCTH